jgi:hypothetical protein
VSATNGKPGELTAISKAKDLVNHTMWASNKVFPKSVRFTLSQRMETAALDVLECLIEANEIFPHSAAETAERLDLQKRALTKCKLLLNLLDIALESGIYRDQVDPAAAGPKAEAHPSKEGISRPKAYRRG